MIRFDPNDYSAYLNAVACYRENKSRQLRTFLSGTSLNAAEKKLLETRLALRANRFTQAREILDSIKSETSDFLMGERSYFYGTYFSASSNWQQGAFHYQEALRIFEAIEEKSGAFISAYNLSVCYSRLGFEKLSSLYLDKAKVFAGSASDAALVLRSSACSYSKAMQFTKATDEIARALELLPQLSSVDATATQCVAADIYFRAGDRDRALNFLTALQRNKSTLEKSPIQLDLLLLRKLQQEKAPYKILPAPPASLKSAKESYYRWQVIRALQGGDPTTAQAFWEKLEKAAPGYYAKNFQAVNASDARNVFFTFLNKLDSRQQSAPAHDPVAAKIQRGKLSILYGELCRKTTPIRKEELIEKIWQERYEPKFDARFYKLIERLRKLGAPVLSVNHSYQLNRS